MSRDDEAARQATYRAEYNLERALDRAAKGDRLVTVFGSTIVMPDTEKIFSHVDHLTTYVTWLSTTDTARAHSTTTVPTVTIDGRRSSGVYEYRHDGRIAVPDDRHGRRETTVVHEFAHHLTRGDGHGPAFRRALIDLIAETIGPTAGMFLTEQFTLADLTIGTPPTPIPTGG